MLQPGVEAPQGNPTSGQGLGVGAARMHEGGYLPTGPMAAQTGELQAPYLPRFVSLDWQQVGRCSGLDIIAACPMLAEGESPRNPEDEAWLQPSPGRGDMSRAEACSPDWRLEGVSSYRLNVEKPQKASPHLDKHQSNDCELSQGVWKQQHPSDWPKGGSVSYF